MESFAQTDNVCLEKHYTPNIGQSFVQTIARKSPMRNCAYDTLKFLPEESNTPIKTSKRMTPKNKNRTGSDHISAEGVEN